MKFQELVDHKRASLDLEASEMQSIEDAAKNEESQVKASLAPKEQKGKSVGKK